jgi:D-glycerate 3-kinase
VTDFVVGIANVRQGTVIVGLCGAQGSGKSTVAAAVSDRLGRDISIATLSIDDLYLSRQDRERLAREVHPLLRTRGVPGTHDVDLGTQVLDSLCRPGRTRLPRFDKAQDARLPRDRWPAVQGPVKIVLFEGWCVGARPQPPEDLAAPVNALERDDDPDGVWRRFANNALAGPYQALFARLHRLVLLAAPGFDVVARWRRQQEHELRARLKSQGRGLEHTMDDAAIERFVQFYERLTQHVLAEIPHRADLLIRLNEERRVVG